MTCSRRLWMLPLLAVAIHLYAGEQQRLSPHDAFQLAAVLSTAVLNPRCLAESAWAASPLDDAQNIQDISTPFLAISMTPGISSYLSDPKTVCTVFAPDNDVSDRMACLRQVWAYIRADQQLQIL
jgi:hypothetical protein